MNSHDVIRNSLFALLLVFAAFAAPRLIAADELPEIANARASVRMWTDGAGLCSVVVIAPGHAYTAAHCLPPLLETGMIEGRKVVAWAMTEGTAFAWLDVPGLECPCAPLASAQPAPGDTVFGVGYPGGYFRVLVYGVVQEPLLIAEARGFTAVSFPCMGGCSGGGVFNRDGRLVGVISAIFTEFSMSLYTPVPLP